MSKFDKTEQDDVWLPLWGSRRQRRDVQKDTNETYLDDEATVTEAVDPADFENPFIDIRELSNTADGRLAVFEAPGTANNYRFRLQLFLEPYWDRLHAAIEHERESGGFFLWQAVFFGLGCVLYFNLPREPLIWAFPALAILSGGMAFVVGRDKKFASWLLVLMAITLGVSVSQWRTLRVDTAMLSRSIIGDVQGQVIRVEHRAGGRVRYQISISSGGIGHRSAQSFDGIIRVTARKGGPEIYAGDMISGKVKIAAPSGPVYPGGYSFAFQSWFNGIGGSGFFLGKPKKVGDGKDINLGIRIAQIRANMAGIIRTVLPGRNGGLAAALIVGDRSGINGETAEILRRSGLAHILAISGLHMGLVAATVIASLRLAFSFFPSLVLYYPVRKWASVAAMLATTIYLVLSGASVSTQRAYIMISIMLLAVLLDHRAISIRNVAIAAIVVLVLTPEAVLLPGFQMSFAAVAALVSAYEYLSKRARNTGANQRMAQYGFLRRFLTRDIGGLALTSIIAGVATGMFAAYHFHRVALFGLLANLGAMPLVSIFVMPLALLGVLAMPFGLEIGPFWLMSWGIEGVVGVAKWVSENTPNGDTGIVPVSGLMFGSVGLLLLCLLKSGLRLIGLPFFGLALLSYGSTPAPDVLILENGAQIGLISQGREMVLSRPRAEKFSTRIWRRAYTPNFAKDLVKKKKSSGFQCDGINCLGVIKDVRIAHVRRASSLLEDCYLGDIVVALVDDEEATLKRFRRKGDSIALEAANPAYETRIFGPDRVNIQGKLVGLIRRYH